MRQPQALAALANRADSAAEILGGGESVDQLTQRVVHGIQSIADGHKGGWHTSPVGRRDSPNIIGPCSRLAVHISRRCRLALTPSGQQAHCPSRPEGSAYVPPIEARLSKVTPTVDRLSGSPCTPSSVLSSPSVIASSVASPASFVSSLSYLWLHPSHDENTWCPLLYRRACTAGGPRRCTACTV